ncbi:MAG: MFS transporter [Oscillospiraceae bacterium]|nr:MFS transporter [Oscillospiraceae bacterium]
MEKDIAKKYNRRIFPVYKGIGWIPLFYRVIIFLFLTETKGLSPSTVLYAEAIYRIFVITFKIPSAVLLERIGSRNALVLGCTLVTIKIALIIFINSFATLLIVYFIGALGQSIKGIAQNTILYDSAKHKKGKTSVASIDAKGSMALYYVEGITTFFTGYLFVINNYLPIVISASVSALSAIIAYRFEEIEKVNKEKITMRESLSNVKQGFKYIAKSRRLRALFLFSSIFGGMLTMMYTYEKSLLRDLQVAPQYFGIIFAILTIVSGIAVKYQEKIHNIFRNKALTFISLPTLIAFIIIGLATISNLTRGIVMTVVFLGFFVQRFLRGPYWTLERKYLSNFTNSDIRPKIVSASQILYGVGTSIIMFFAGLLLDHYYTNMAYIIVGVVGTAVMLLVLSYMKPRIGLNPEKYSDEDILYYER